MIDRLSEPDPPRTIQGEIINILMVSGQPVTINGLISRITLASRERVVETLAALVQRGDVRLVEVHGRQDCLSLPEGVVDAEKIKKRKTAKQAAFESIMAFLADGPKTRGEIAAHIGTTKTSVTNFVREMEVDQMVERLAPIKLPGSIQPQVLIRIKVKK